MKKQVDARRLAQIMVGIGRRMDKKVQALITDMNQPLGYAIGNALEVMEASQTLQNAGPADLTKLSLELAARMIFLGKKAATLEEARRIAEKHLVDGSAYQKFKQVVAAQGGNPQALDKFELLPNATGMREITSPRAGYVSRIDAEDIGVPRNMIGAGRDRKEDSIDPGGRHHPRSQDRREGGCRLRALPPLLHQGRSRGRSRRDGGRRLPHLRAEARRARTDPGSRRLMGRFTGFLGLVVILAVAWLFSTHKRDIKLRIIAWGLGLQFAFAVLVLKTDFGKVFQAHRRRRQRHAGATPRPAASSCSARWASKGGPYGVIFAFQVLPIIIFIASFFSILYYLGVMQCGGQGHGDRDAEGHGRERRGIAQRGGQHLHGPDGSAADHQAVPRRADGIRTVHHHDQRHGARLRAR